MMTADAYALAVLLYPTLLISTLLVGGWGIWVNREGTRRVGVVMIGCQLLMLALAGLFHWPELRLPSMAVINGLCAVPLLMKPIARLQRFSAGLFIASGLMTGMFACFDETPVMIAWQWFTSAGIDLAMIMMLGGFCGGLVGKDLAARLRDHARGASRPGHIR